MGSRTAFWCDRCGKNVDHSERFWTVSIERPRMLTTTKKELCDKCHSHLLHWLQPEEPKAA